MRSRSGRVPVAPVLRIPIRAGRQYAMTPHSRRVTRAPAKALMSWQNPRIGSRAGLRGRQEARDACEGPPGSLERLLARSDALVGLIDARGGRPASLGRSGDDHYSSLAPSRIRHGYTPSSVQAGVRATLCGRWAVVSLSRQRLAMAVADDRLTLRRTAKVSKAALARPLACRPRVISERRHGFRTIDCLMSPLGRHTRPPIHDWRRQDRRCN